MSQSVETDMRALEAAFGDPVLRHYYRARQEDVTVGSVALCGRVKVRPVIGVRAAQKFPMCGECAAVAGREV